jgi:putative membrane protein insertion efficiency factor
VKRVLVAIVLAPIRFYSRFVSPALPRRCKYEPTCSAYAQQAVRELGIVRGTIVAGWRLLRCNPWSHGGWDPVGERSLFRDEHAPRHDPGAPA